MNKTPKQKFSFFKFAASTAFLLLSALPAFAQAVLPPQMQTLAENIRDIFQSDFVKVILAIFLCGAAVAYAFNKDNEKIKRNCIAIAIASAILITAQSIVTAVWNASGG